MDINYLNTFQTVIKKDSFSKAAKALGISQPAVSFQIHGLEKLFGQTFFVRMGGKLQLTEAGQIMDRYSREILKISAQLENSFVDLSGKISGVLKIGASSIPGNYILPGVIGNFIKEYPEVRPVLEIEDTAKIIDRLLAREIDFAFVGFPSNKKTLKMIPFVEDEILIVAKTDLFGSKKSAKIDKSELIKLPFILREEGSGTRSSFERAINEAGVSVHDLKVVFEVGGNEAALNAVESGLGVTAISSWAARKSIELKTVLGLTIKGVNLKRMLYFAYRKGSKFSKAGQEFATFVTAKSMFKKP